MDKLVCRDCGSKLKLGQFAHNQNTCWDCFKLRIVDIRNTCEDKEDFDAINWMLAVIAEIYGYKW